MFNGGSFYLRKFLALLSDTARLLFCSNSNMGGCVKKNTSGNTLGKCVDNHYTQVGVGLEGFRNMECDTRANRAIYSLWKL